MQPGDGKGIFCYDSSLVAFSFCFLLLVGCLRVDELLFICYTRMMLFYYFILLFWLDDWLMLNSSHSSAAKLVMTWLVYSSTDEPRSKLYSLLNSLRAAAAFLLENSDPATFASTTYVKRPFLSSFAVLFAVALCFLLTNASVQLICRHVSKLYPLPWNPSTRTMSCFDGCFLG